MFSASRLVLGAALATCASCLEPDFDFNFDLSTGSPGQLGVAEFRFVEGCPGLVFLELCGVSDYPLALGARTNIEVGWVAEDADDSTLLSAEVRSSDPRILFVHAVDTPRRNLVISVSALATGTAEIEIVMEGRVTDRISITIDEIARLSQTSETQVVLAGRPVGVRVYAFNAQGQLLFAHRAVAATVSTGVLEPFELGPTNFKGSDQIAMVATRAGDEEVTLSVGSLSTTQKFTAVTSADVTDVELVVYGPFPDDNTATVLVYGSVDNQLVRGAVGCAWTLSGDATLEASVNSDTYQSFLTIYERGRVYPLGPGAVNVECRVSETVFAQTSIHFP